MRKLRLLFATCALLIGTAVSWAQTDVTSMYLTNADFSQSTPIASNLKGYGKDGTPYGFQAVDGWSYKVTSGDNSNASYPNSGMAGAVFAYGSSYQLQGNNKAAPSVGPDDGAGQGLGFFAVWGCGGYYYQNVTLAAGKYTLTFPIYNQSGTQANTTYTGFFPTSGTNRTVAINTTVGSWVSQTVTFTLADATAGQIRIGYQSTGSGSGANPHLFFDGVKIEFTAIVVKDALSTALAAANKANSTLGTLTEAIATAQAVYDDENATQDEVNAAAATLSAAIELAMSAAGDVTGIFLTNPGFESCTVTTNNAGAGGNAAPKDIAGGWTQSSSAAWSSSAVVVYGGSGQVNGANAPSADNAGNGGNTLGISVGWGGLVTYQTDALTLPAGVYTLKAYAYNNLSGVTQFSSKFGFIPTEGSSTLSTKTSFAYATWVTDEVTFTLNEATTGVIQVGGQAISGGSGSNAKVFFDNITITYKSFLAGAKSTWDEAVADAEAAKAECPNVIGTELTTLNAELAKAEPTTVADYNAAEEALEAATAALRAAKANYDALVAEIAYAKTIGIAEATADGYAATSTSTAASALTSMQNLKVAEYTHITTNYSETANLGDWTETFAEDLDGEGYVTGGAKYWNEWGTNTRTGKQTLTLPAGDYAISVIARGAAGTSGYLYYKIGENEAVTTPLLMKGNRGRGVDTDGTANFSDQGTYTCNNEGFGWEYRFLTFTLPEESSVELGVSATFANNWVSIYAPKLFTTMTSVKSVVLAFINDELTNNIPVGKMNANVFSALNEKKTAAQNASMDNTKDELETILSELRTAIAAANNSIKAYKVAAAMLPKMLALTESTNVYTDEALNTYYTQWKTKYDNNTLTTDEANALQDPAATTGWHASISVDDFLLSAWNTEPDFTNSPYYINTWSTEGNTDGSGMTTPFFEYFVDYTTEGKLAARTLTATLKDVEPGNYAVDLLVRVSKNGGAEETPAGITLDLNGGTAVDLCTGVKDANARFYGTFRALGTVDNDGVMRININVAEDNNVHWLAFKNVKYSVFDGATEEQKSALAEAIAEAEAKTLGFEDGQYAPYNNLEVLEALDAAKAIDVEKATATEIADAITALDGWTANDGNVDAIFNGSFSSESDWGLTGWTRTNAWGQQQTGLGDPYATAYYNQPGSLVYGNTGKYTMPLAANTFYKLTFAYRAHENGSNTGMTVSVLNGEDGLAATTYAGNGSTTDWSVQSKFFETGAAGNYVLTLGNGGNTWMTGVSLVKAAVSDLTADLAAAKAEAEGYLSNDDYANIKGSERAALIASCETTPEETASAYYALIQEIKTNQAAFIAAKDSYDALADAIAVAQAVVDAGVNVGDAAFQISTDIQTTLSAAVTAASNAQSDDETTAETAVTATETLNEAVTTYNNAQLNVPEETQAYNLIFNCNGHDYTGNALTLIPNVRKDQGVYGLKYQAPANPNLAQAFYFTHTTGNKYKVAAIDQEGVTRYITTQAEGYGTTWYEGIRTITDASMAMEIEIRPNGEGLYLLWNTGANKPLAHNGNNNNDMFTNNTANFQLVEAQKPSITINTTAAGYGTTMLPFAVTEIPQGVAVYACAAVNGNSLTLESVLTMEANKPYIIEGAWNETLTGDAQGTQLSYTEGLLTGTYAKIAAPDGSYILQNQNGKVGFYRVDNKEAQPNVPANRAYLIAPAGANARAAFFFGNETTGIAAVEALTSGEAEIFDANGIRQERLVKGLNIVRTRDGKTQKIMVK